MTTRAPSHVLSGRRPRRSLTRFLADLLRLGAIARSRGRLARLDDHLLQDIGLTREEAEAEATRPIWDVPSHWKQY
jgi:uncharacterized protein YjiS (DUF1127 family)